MGGTPWALIDGLYSSSYTYSGLKPYVENRLSASRPMTISLNAVYYKNTKKLNISGTVAIEQTLSSGTWKIYLFVLESKISSGGRNNDFVLRQMQVYDLSKRNANDKNDFSWEFTPDSGWKIENMSAGAFVQKIDQTNPFNVYQAKMVASITISNDVAVSSLGLIKALLK
jgi:hypothetical protein